MIDPGRDPRAGVYGRVDDDLGEPLTQEQVDALTDGTEVIIVWSGGNGPHRYSILRGTRTGAVYARSESESDAEFAEAFGYAKTLGYQDPITFVGAQYFHTRVWLLPGGTE